MPIRPCKDCEKPSKSTRCHYCARCYALFKVRGELQAKAPSSALRPPDKAPPPIQRRFRLGAVMLEVFTPKPQRRPHP